MTLMKRRSASVLKKETFLEFERILNFCEGLLKLRISISFENALIYSKRQDVLAA